MSELPWNRPRFKNWLAVAKVHTRWAHMLATAIQPLGLKVSQFDILANLLYEPGLTQQRLAEKLLIGRSNLSMALPDLEALGWVRRDSDAEDRRVRRLYLTDEGERMARLGLAAETALLDFMMGALQDEECNQLGDYMRRINEHLKTWQPPRT